LSDVVRRPIGHRSDTFEQSIDIAIETSFDFDVTRHFESNCGCDRTGDIDIDIDKPMSSVNNFSRRTSLATVSRASNKWRHLPTVSSTRRKTCATGDEHTASASAMQSDVVERHEEKRERTTCDSSYVRFFFMA
jgi:hypothetical protein